MNKLNCKATKCVNNNSGLCNATNIDIIGDYAHHSSDTHCYTFRENTVKSALSNLSNVNFFGEIKQMFSSGNSGIAPEVMCSARECYHNNGGRCSANNIMISGDGSRSMDGTYCETFVEAY